MTVFSFVSSRAVADKSFVGVKTGARVKTRIRATGIHIYKGQDMIVDYDS